MPFLLLLTIALPLVLVPSQVLFDAGDLPRLQTKLSATLAGWKPFSDDVCTSALDVATLCAGWPTVVSHARVVKPIDGDVDANRPVMLAQAQQPRLPGRDKTISDVPNGARATKESCLGPVSTQESVPETLELAAVLNGLG